MGLLLSQLFIVKTKDGFNVLTGDLTGGPATSSQASDVITRSDLVVDGNAPLQVG